MLYTNTIYTNESFIKKYQMVNIESCQLGEKELPVKQI